MVANVKIHHIARGSNKNLLLIDPKINLRVNKNTPMRIYELGSELTKAGLGFPQYSNDDVVVDGLVKLGYELADARNYVTAACWEFIIPAVGGDVDNIGAMSFPKVVDICLHRDLLNCETFDDFMVKISVAFGYAGGTIIGGNRCGASE